MKKKLFTFLLITILVTIISAQKTENDKGVAPEGGEIFQIVEEMPLFPGCNDIKSKKEKEECSTEKLFQYIFENLNYPELAIKNSTEGRVILRFAVKKDGSITHIRILRDIGDGCGDAAKKVIESMNQNHIKWIPGKQGGREVGVWYTVPVLFKLTDAQKKKIKESKNEELIKFVDEMPLFPGCEDKESKKEKTECSTKKLKQYIDENLKYPELAIKNSIEGRVILRFIIMKDGSIENIRILRDIGDGCGDAAKKVFESMNQNHIKWIPGKQGGREVSIWYTTPVIFRLSSEKQ